MKTSLKMQLLAFSTLFGNTELVPKTQRQSKTKGFAFLFVEALIFLFYIKKQSELSRAKKKQQKEKLTT